MTGPLSKHHVPSTPQHGGTSNTRFPVTNYEGTLRGIWVSMRFRVCFLILLSLPLESVFEVWPGSGRRRRGASEQRIMKAGEVGGGQVSRSDFEISWRGR